MSTRRLLALAVIAVTPLLAACGSSDDGATSASPPATAVPVATAAPVTDADPSGGGGLGGAIQSGVDGIDAAGPLACDANRATLQVAVDAATMLDGTPPVSQDQLVGQYLVEPVPGYTIASDGTVQPVDGGPCVGH